MNPAEELAPSGSIQPAERSTSKREEEPLILWLRLKCAHFTAQSSPIKPPARMTCLCVKISTTKLKSGARIVLIYLANTPLARVRIFLTAGTRCTQICAICNEVPLQPSPRITHISKHKRPSPCQPWRCGCGWLFLLKSRLMSIEPVWVFVSL